MKERILKLDRKFVTIIAISVVLIIIGIFIYFFESNQRMIAKGIDNITTIMEKKLFMNTKNLNVGEDYTINGDLTFNIESNYLNQLATYSSEYQTYANLINNLSKTKNKVVIKHDKTNKKLFMSLDSNYNGIDLLDLKYLIENNTEYYYIKGFMDSYINNGTSNYFEALDNNTTNKENMEYIYKFVLSSFKSNLKDDYFKKETVKVKIDNKEKTYKKTTLSIDDKILKEIAKNILSDLKNDKKANKILVSIDKDFKKAKVSSSTNYLSDGEKIEFSVYSNNIYQIKKYELKYVQDNNNTLLTYEVSSKKLESYVNDQLQGYLEFNSEKDKTNINIMDSNSKNIGKITITKTKDSYSITTNFSVSEVKITMSIENKISNVIKNKSYNQNLILKASIVSNNVSLANINMNINSKVKKGVKINEDTSNVILASDVSEDKKEAFMNTIMTTLTNLMS